MKTFFCLLLTVAVLLQSCRKHEGIPTESTYTFANHVGERITFDVYGSQADYFQNAHRLMRYSIPKDSSQAMTLEVGKVYWVDWYNGDYSLSNWRLVLGNANPLLKLSPSEFSSSIEIKTSGRDTTRSILLNGGADTASKWAGYNVSSTNDTTRYWVVFSKDKTCRISYQKGTAGAAITTSFNYTRGLYKTEKDGTESGFSIQLATATTVPSDYIYWGTTIPNWSTIDRDILFMVFPRATGSPDALLLRQ